MQGTMNINSTPNNRLIWRNV